MVQNCTLSGSLPVSKKCTFLLLLFFFLWSSCTSFSVYETRLTQGLSTRCSHHLERPFLLILSQTTCSHSGILNIPLLVQCKVGRPTTPWHPSLFSFILLTTFDKNVSVFLFVYLFYLFHRTEGCLKARAISVRCTVVHDSLCLGIGKEA